MAEMSEVNWKLQRIIERARSLMDVAPKLRQILRLTQSISELFSDLSKIGILICFSNNNLIVDCVMTEGCADPDQILLDYLQHIGINGCCIHRVSFLRARNLYKTLKR
eukprot:391737_1